MKYELGTLRDVFEKVPADKIEKCLSELAIAMKQAREMQELLSEVEAMFEWPVSCTWIDNGSGIIRLNFYEGGEIEKGIVLTTKLGNGA